MRTRLAAIACLIASAGATAQQAQPHTNLQTIRVSGDPAIAPLLESWENQFRLRYPNVSFQNRLSGPASAMAGLYTKTADLAFAGHELLTSESMAFEWIFHYKALPIEVTSGSLDGPSFAPGFFVNARNPLAKLTLAKANALLGCKDGAVPNWSALGLNNEWANRPIHVYSYDPESEVGIFLRRKILKNSYKWNCEMKTFEPAKGNSAGEADRRIMQALRADPYGVGIANSRYATEEVKALSLASYDSGPGVTLSAQSIVQREYPLTRPFFVYIDRAPGKAPEELVSRFLQFVLSAEGQQLVNSSAYLPLNESVAREQRRKLE